MIIPTRWKDVGTGSRVIDPAGQVFHVLPRVVGFMVQLRSRRRHGMRLAPDMVATLAPDPEAYVPRLLEPSDIAVAQLAVAFPTLEFLWEE